MRRKFYYVKVHMWERASGTRVEKWVPIRLPHEIVQEQFARNPDSMDVRKQDPDEVMLPSFTEHPVVKERGLRNTVPVGLYSDSTPVYQKDSCWAGFMNIFWLRIRHVLWLLLKGTMCACGCNGQCTTGPVMVAINGSFNCLASGYHMRGRFDGLPWREEDIWRAELAGSPLAKCGACTELRCDWPEHCGVAGLKQWNARCPCPKCRCLQRNMHTEYHRCSIDSLPWDERTMDDYLDELDKQIIHVKLDTEEDRELLAANTRFRKTHPWGRSIIRAMQKFELKGEDTFIPIVAENFWTPSPWIHW